jgi:putative spermidine/putrescine transport system permease protein
LTAHRPGRLVTLLALLVGLFLLLPLLAVVPVSFTPLRYLSMPTAGGEWSLRHYRTLVEDPDWIASIWLSLRIAAISAVLATLLATLFGLGIWYFRPWFTASLVGFVLLPMVVPPVVSALALYFLTTRLSGLGAGLVGYDSMAGVVLAHTVMNVPFAVVVVLVALSRLDRRIEMAARGLGASLFQTTWRVVLPSLRFGIASSLLLTFILSWEEIAVTLFITSVDTITLPRRVWMGLRDNIDPAVAAISVVLILVTVAALVAALAQRARAAAAPRPATEEIR